MNGGNMMRPRDEQNFAAVTPEQVAAILSNVEKLMQSMACALSATNQRMENLERQVQMLTPITGAQERAIGEKIKARASELCAEYKLPGTCAPAIANAIRKDLKVYGGVRAIRELPRVEYPVYVERINLWDDFAAMRQIRKNGRYRARVDRVGGFSSETDNLPR